MSGEWVKLAMDCSWKRLQEVGFRCVPGPPTDLVLVGRAQSGEQVFKLTEEFTINPTWTLPAIPHKKFPVCFELQTSAGSLIWTDSIDLRRLFFVTSDLKDLERTPSLAMILHFRGDGFYTVESLAPMVCEAARNNNDQIKILGTSCAQARSVDFTKLQHRYSQ